MAKIDHRAVLAEFLGSAALATIVVGSGIAAQRLSPSDVGVQLLENAASTAAGLFVLIIVLAPLSGAHLNPVVSLLDAALGHRPWRDLAAYIPGQIAGCTVGAILANTMFALPGVQISTTERLSPAHFLSEVIATAGLGVVIFVLSRTGRANYAAAAVALYIGAAYFFTSSTSFANPAITIGRMFTDTFAGIAPVDAPGFIAAQLLGGAVAIGAIRLLVPQSAAPAPHRPGESLPVKTLEAIRQDHSAQCPQRPGRRARRHG